MNDLKMKKSDRSSKKHKHKKSKKYKKKREVESSPSTSDSDREEMEWVEASVTKAKTPEPEPEMAKEKRDEWMNEELFVSTLTRNEMMSGGSRARKKELEMQRREKEEEIQKQRELNPHWKNSGTGLPEEDLHAEDLKLPSTSVGDGGYSYLKKAYLRIQEQAQDEGRSMEEVAVERWGSLDKLVALIDEAESRMKQHSIQKYGSVSTKRSNWREEKGSRSFKKPSHRDHSPSPERSSHRYQRPKHYDRSKKKFCNISSSKKSHRSSSGSAPERRDRSISPSFKHSTSPVPEYRASFTRSERHVPAWKKVKHKEENKTLPDDHADKYSEDSSSPKRTFSERIDLREQKRTSPLSDVRPVITSEDDLNKLAAKYFKADLMGDKKLASKLKAELDLAREAFKAGDKRVVNKSATARERERVLLTKADSSGQQRPIQSSREDAGFERRTGHKKPSNKYFDDSSKYSLKQMFEREKLTTAEDNLEMFLDVAAECKDKIDDEAETSGISKKAANKMAHAVQEEKDIGRAIQQHQKLAAALEKCEYCLDQVNMKRHLIVTIGEQVYISIPNYQSLSDGHCLIVPKRHVSSFLALDEDEWREFEDMKGLLRRFFKEQQKALLCLETSMYFGKCPHAIVECIPVPEEDGDMAPLYFKKAILESEEEWAHNVKLVDLTKRGLRRSVPKNLPYFCVLFDPSVHVGYAHVIEDEKSFPRNFGKEVVGGMLDIDYNFLYKNRREDPLKKSNEALEFTKMLEKFKDENS